MPQECLVILTLAAALLHRFDFAVAALEGPSADEITCLPGYGHPPSPQWSGFLDASAEEPGSHLHYWLAEAEVPGSAQLPLVLWLNGGPGASSIWGLLQEVGPLLINATGGLLRNPYAWTRHANLLVLESPAGVGWSHCAAMTRGQPCANSDISTAKASRAALQDFYRKFPGLLMNELYIIGESYAGIYVPTLAEQLLLHAPEVNLKGIAAGNPCTDNAAQRESMDLLWYSHKNGLVPDADFDFLRGNCSFRAPPFLSQGRWLRVQGSWASAGPESDVSKGPETDFSKTPGASPSGPCCAAKRRFLASTSRSFSPDWNLAFLSQLSLFGPAAVNTFSQKGSLNYMMAEWMNRADVKLCLHAGTAPVGQWPGPPDGWSYSGDYDACNPLPHARSSKSDSMIDFYRRLAPKLRQTIVYNGDTDPCVPYEGTREAVKRIGFEEVEGGQYRPWFYFHAAASREILSQKPLLFGPNLNLVDAGPQMGGHVVNYEHNLAFVSVHGAGHMVPQVRPQAAERLLRKLLSGKPLAPFLPNNSALELMTDDTFDQVLDEWVEAAEKIHSNSSMVS